MPLFRGYVAVDWSASSEPVDGANSIWIAYCGLNGAIELKTPRTRCGAMRYIYYGSILYGWRFRKARG